MPERPKAPQPRNEMVYQGLRLNVHRDARGYLYPTLRKPALTADFTYEHFCQEAAQSEGPGEEIGALQPHGRVSDVTDDSCDS